MNPLVEFSLGGKARTHQDGERRENVNKKNENENEKRREKRRRKKYFVEATDWRQQQASDVDSVSRYIRVREREDAVY